VGTIEGSSSSSILKDQCGDYDVEPVIKEYRSGSDMNDALKHGEIDAATVGRGGTGRRQRR